MCITVIVGYAHNLCTDRRHDKLFILHLARAMHLAPCVPVRFVTGSIAAHLHPPRSSTIISSNRGRKSTPSPESSLLPSMENHRSYSNIRRISTIKKLSSVFHSSPLRFLLAFVKWPSLVRDARSIAFARSEHSDNIYIYTNSNTSDYIVLSSREITTIFELRGNPSASRNRSDIFIRSIDRKGREI